MLSYRRHILDALSAACRGKHLGGVYFLLLVFHPRQDLQVYWELSRVLLASHDLLIAALGCSLIERVAVLWLEAGALAVHHQQVYGVAPPRWEPVD